MARQISLKNYIRLRKYWRAKGCGLNKRAGAVPTQTPIDILKIKHYTYYDIAIIYAQWHGYIFI